MRKLKTTAQCCAILLALLWVCSARTLGQQSEPQGVQRLFVPGTQRALDLDLSNFQTYFFEKETDRIPNNDGRVREFLAMLKFRKDSPMFVLLKIRVEPERAAGGAAALRDVTLTKHLKRKGVNKG
ncbi:MAG TPA: hypothetical protein VF507_08960, partial [Pyrinomonadaceae bacterium]